MANPDYGPIVPSLVVLGTELQSSNLEENFSYWKAKWAPCKQLERSDIEGFGLRTTTTFPYEKRWGAESTYPFREILFNDEALLSERRRILNNKIKPSEPRREMTRAREVGLDHYVFSYMGIHDPYYADQSTFPNPPFGAFIGIDLESYPNCNATRRDVGSPEAEWPPHREFLLPQSARAMSHLQVRNDARHVEDFWHYWGAPKYWREEARYADSHWEWQIEFHYYDNIPISQLDAVLWPVEFRALGPRKRETSLLEGEASRFRDAHPECKVIPYQWSPGNPTMSFIKASYAVARFFLMRERYPHDADEALEVLVDEL